MRTLAISHFLKPMATLDLLNLTKRFGDVAAVNGITLEVADAEFLCLLGPSGCGKSTALRMTAGFETPTLGDVQIDGASVIDLAPNRRPTAMVFQKFTLWPHMRIYDNIAFGLRLRGMGKSELDREVNAALEMVGLPKYGSRYPAQLSGGEQQRIALARALVLKPKILNEWEADRIHMSLRSYKTPKSTLLITKMLSPTASTLNRVPSPK